MLVMRKLSEALQAQANSELNEVTKRIPEDVTHIRNWLNKQPQIIGRIDDQWILTFLRGGKFSLEKTKKKLDSYYTMRNFLPEICKNRDPFGDDVQRVLQQRIVIPLSKSTVTLDSHCVLLRSDYDPSMLNAIDIIKTIFMMLEIVINEYDSAIIGGLNIICDMQNVTLSHFSLSVCMFEKLVHLLQTYPFRIKNISFINVNPIFDIGFKLFKPFIPKKIVNRMDILTKGNINKLHEIISLSILPRELGGDTLRIDELNEIWKKKLESYTDWFEEDSKYKTVEKLRPEKPITTTDVFPNIIEGSFRKLNFD